MNKAELPLISQIKKIGSKKVRNLVNIKDFYLSVNRLASQILEDRDYWIRILNGTNNEKRKALLMILGYGNIINKKSDLKNSSQVSLSEIKRNKKYRLELLNFEKRANLFFFHLKTIGDHSKEELYEQLKIALQDVEVLKRSHQILSDTRPNNRKNLKKYTYTFPKEDKFDWSKLELKFKDGMEEMEIFYNSKLVVTKSYIELGFSANKKEYRPNREWELLKALSIHQETDFVNASPNNLPVSFQTKQGQKFSSDNLHQTKKLLSKSLKVIFQTESSPFEENRNHYQPKFKIQPSPDLRKGVNEWRSRSKGYNDNIRKFDDNKHDEYKEENQYP